jgi:hypothetical protein
MRTAEEIRAHLLRELRHASRRPGMYGGNEFGVELYFLGRLGDLCFVDSRDGALEAEIQSLRARKVSRAAGVYGVLRDRISQLGGKPDRFNLTNEVTSVYAEVAHRLGYLDVERQLSDAEWRNLTTTLRGRFGRRRPEMARVGDVIAAYGAPSRSIGGNWSNTLCYVSDQPPDPWVCFDAAVDGDLFRGSFAGDPVRQTRAWLDHVGNENPPVYAVRWQTARSFRMFFTAYGARRLTYGRAESST